MKTGRGATTTGGAATTGAGTGTRTHPAKLVATAARNSSEAASRPNEIRAMAHPPASLDEARPGDVSHRSAGHPDLLDGGGGIEGLAFSGGLEPASLVQREGWRVGGRHPEGETGCPPSARPTDDRVDERGADTASARLGGDEHSDDLRAWIVGHVGVARQARDDAEPPAVVLGDEGDVVDSRGAALRALAPDVVRERLLSRQGRAERRRRIRQRPEAKGP